MKYIGKSKSTFICYDLCLNYVQIKTTHKHNEQINSQNVDNSECFGVKIFKIYPEMTSQYFFDIERKKEKIGI